MRVILECRSNSMHLAQLYTGFGELEGSGVITCDWIVSGQHSAYRYSTPYLEARLNDDLVMLYDETDDFCISESIDFSKIDFLLKRSFNPTYVVTHPFAQKILPLGLNYFVLGKHDRRVHRVLRAKNDWPKLRHLLKVMIPSRLQFLTSTPSTAVQISNYEYVPDILSSPKVLFITQLWRPSRVSSPELKEDRERINQMRVELVKLLRQEFKSHFIGGLVANDYAVEHHKDCVIENTELTKKQNFIQLVKDSPICVTSNGLLGSIGYRFAEYIAASRAVVSERNVNRVYGDFQVGRNHLDFTTPEECVEQTMRLFNDDAFRGQMMWNNYLYYHRYLRPDMVVLNSLYDVLEASGLQIN